MKPGFQAKHVNWTHLERLRAPALARSSIPGAAMDGAKRKTDDADDVDADDAKGQKSSKREERKGDSSGWEWVTQRVSMSIVRWFVLRTRHVQNLETQSP